MKKDEAGVKAAIKRILSSEDFFDILGVARGSDNTRAIKMAYRSLAVKLHPDTCLLKGKGLDFACEAFKKVGHAFAVLRDEETRRHYTQHGDSAGEEMGLADAYNLFRGMFVEKFELSPVAKGDNQGDTLVGKNHTNIQHISSVAGKLAKAKRGGKLEEEWDGAMDTLNREEKRAL
jgi:DnaJ-class molecular chaperone